MNCKIVMLLLALSLCFATSLLGQNKVSILGDSYSTFYGYITPANNQCWYGEPGSTKANDVKRVEDVWWYHLIHTHGLELECNNSFSGSTICNTGYSKEDYSDRSFVTRMTNLGKPDIIIIFGGTNDSWAGSPLGQLQYEGWTKQDLYNFRPAFCRLLDYLTKQYPHARLFNITNTQLSAEVTSSIEEICRHYSILNILLQDIDKQLGHPSIKGMESISNQVWEAMGQTE